MNNIALNRYVYYTSLLIIVACIGTTASYSYVYLTLPGIPLKPESVATVKWPSQTIKTIYFDGSIFKNKNRQSP